MCQESGIYDHWTKVALRSDGNNLYNQQENHHVTFMSNALNLAQLFDLFNIYIRSIVISSLFLIMELIFRRISKQINIFITVINFSRQIILRKLTFFSNKYFYNY